MYILHLWHCSIEFNSMHKIIGLFCIAIVEQCKRSNIQMASMFECITIPRKKRENGLLFPLLNLANGSVVKVNINKHSVWQILFSNNGKAAK